MGVINEGDEGGEDWSGVLVIWNKSFYLMGRGRGRGGGSVCAKGNVLAHMNESHGQRLVVCSDWTQKL